MKLVGLGLVVATVLTLGAISPRSPSAADVMALASPPRSAAFMQSFGLEPSSATASTQACCKVCTKGKACGDTCIAREKTCRTPPGCACDG